MPGVKVREAILSTPGALEELLQAQFSTSGLSASLKGKRVIIHGCGSSYHLALILKSILRGFLKTEVVALPSSELIFYPQSYFYGDCALISISRSGKTIETSKALEIYRKTGSGVAISFLCSKEGLISHLSDFLFIADVQEENVPSVKTFSALLFLALKVLSELFPVTVDLSSVVSRLKVETEKALEFSERLKGDFSSLIFLGSGPFYGLARELALKVVEMAGGRAFAFHSLEFRHGPRLLLEKDSLFFLLTHPESPSYPEEVILYRELEGKSPHLAIDCRGTHTNPLSFRPSSAMSFWESFFIQLLLGQALALRIGLNRGLNPDSPPGLSPFVVLPD